MGCVSSSHDDGAKVSFFNNSGRIVQAEIYLMIFFEIVQLTVVVGKVLWMREPNDEVLYSTLQHVCKFIAVGNETSITL